MFIEYIIFTLAILVGGFILALAVGTIFMIAADEIRYRKWMRKMKKEGKLDGRN